ncbi:MAG TPA: acetylxylan esterase [Solirubrobacterales bacterium]|nr:acetylxylan esterase [Solirubrobacterales bacterium]
MIRKLVLLFAAFAAIGLIGAGSAAAAPPPLGISCTVAGDNSLQCGSTSPRSTAETWDGTPIDVNIALPDPAEFGTGPYPLVMMFHGYGQSKLPFAQMAHYTDKGYAAFTMSDRGMAESCGSVASVAADPDGCDGQYIHMLDDRYEVRDAQYFAGELVDEGWVDPARIAATGGSYGGGMSMALAALKDRTMLPNGFLVPWKSPAGTPISLAVATPLVPWTDLAYSLSPNGRVLDYLRENPYDPEHIGIMKSSIINGLYLSGNAIGRYAPVGTYPQADMTGWRLMMDQGEPYQSDLAFSAMLSEITTYHSSYYIDDSVKPAPMLISLGFTDDIFGVDEGIRYINRTLATYPDADIALMAADVGHQRAQNKAADGAAVFSLQDKWIDYYLTGAGAKPANNVTAYTEVCPNAEPSAGPYTAANWASLAPGEITVEGGKADQTIEPDGGSADVANAYGVIANNACASPSGAREPGTANYESDPAPAGGFTLLGSPTVIADFEGGGRESEIAARLVDLAPDNTKQLVARQLYRPNASGYQVFQLHPGAWTFKEGHIARLELLPKDASTPPSSLNLSNYGRPSDMQQTITVHDLVLRLPVIESPGGLGGLVKAPAAKILPDDRRSVDLAPGYSSSQTMADWAASRPGPDPTPTVQKLKVSGPVSAKGTKATVKVSCPASAASCAKARIDIHGAPKNQKARGAGVLIGMVTGVTVNPGKSKTVSIPMTVAARNLFKDQKGKKGKKGKKGLKSLAVQVVSTSTAGESVLKINLKRTGKVK